MNAISSSGAALCGVCVAVSVLSALIPQKRTVKIFSFAMGLFIISSLINVITVQSKDVDLNISEAEEYTVPLYSEDDYNDKALQMTADNLTKAISDLLINEGIQTDDIRLELKITNDGRIYVSRAVIYINEDLYPRRDDIKRIVYGNLSKEPEIYVTGQ